uniref:Carrier domain-containing protein n=1 Tax=Bionectria ochroleuca TaxID=29856 RepID=A0A8H7K7F4_BIOOC
MNDIEFKGQQPIAIVGMGCRMPGEVRSPSDLWELLISKGVGRSDKFQRPGGFFLEDDLGSFDPSMFKISPAEAAWMDPQQRKLLEVVYEAFESSGTSLDEISGKRIGCFVGCFSLDFQFMALKEPDFRRSYITTGIDTGILPNRVSHVFNLKGPSTMLNTACSSSLYALDLACKAISSGECEGAIVGGTNLMMTVDQQMNTAKMGVLSPNSQSRPFDNSADGYARGEGIGALYLKPLSAALRDGDPVRSIIRSTVSSHNGYNKDGISHPNVEGQAALISLAYELANLDPEETSYIECHGTGTSVGDPIELEAIQKTMGGSRAPGNPILVGSVKGNVGHSEAASSIATIIKATLVLENGIIPPTAMHTNPTSSIPWDEFNVQVVTEPTSFPTTASVARIGINAFGYGGTNSHAILESAKTVIPEYCGHKGAYQVEMTGETQRSTQRSHLLLFSAHNAQTLQTSLSKITSSSMAHELKDLAYTLAVRRTKFDHRTFAVVQKDTFRSGVNDASNAIVSIKPKETVTAFVFTGQGAQWPSMGSSLLETYPSVLQTIQRLDKHLSTSKIPPSWTIESILTDPDQIHLVQEPEYAQPLCTAVQISLVNLMSQWGVKPVATVGHSSGEIAAAYAAGIISEETAIITAYLRGNVAASLRTDGAMLSIGLGAKDASTLIEEHESCRDRVVVACHNSSRNVTLSGDRDAIEKLKDAADAKGIFARVLRTGGKLITRDTRKTLQPRILICSNLHHRSTKHLYRQQSPVLFNSGVEEMLKEMTEVNLLVEVGPHPALKGPLRDICQTTNNSHVGYLNTLKRQENDVDQMLQLAGSLWSQGDQIDIERVTSVEEMGKLGTVQVRPGTLLVDLPTYGWTYPKPVLGEARASKEHRQMKEPRHDILGRRVIGASPLEPLWRNVLRHEDVPWLTQHQVAGEVMLPAAAYLALAMEAIEQVNAHSAQPIEIHSYTIRDVVISTATVVLDDDDGTETMFRLRPVDGNLNISEDGVKSQWYEFSASCCPYGTWKEAARGLVALNIKRQGVDSQRKILPDTPNRHSHSAWLARYKELGVYLGPAFHHIDDLWMDGKTNILRGDIGISQECGLMKDESRYVLHPTVIDSCLQPFAAMLHQGVLSDLRCNLIPTQFGEVTFFPPSREALGERCMVQQWSNYSGKRTHSANVQLVDHNGALIMDIVDSRSIEYRAALSQDLQGHLQEDLYMKLHWNVDHKYLSWANEAGHFDEQPLEKVLDIILHKETTSRVLSLHGNLNPDSMAARPAVQMTVAVSHQEKAKFDSQPEETGDLAYVDVDSMFLENEKVQQKFDVVIDSVKCAKSRMQQLRELTSPGGTLLLLREKDDHLEDCRSALESAGFSGVELCLADRIILSTALDPYLYTNGHGAHRQPIVLVYKDSPSSLQTVLSQKLQEEGWDVRSQRVASIEDISGARAILLCDTESPFLSELDEDHLKGLINLTETASSIIWITCGGLLQGELPQYGMTAGAARTIRIEKESLDLVTIDFDIATTSEDRVAALAVDVAYRQRTKGRNGESEYQLQGGVPFIGRVIPHRALHRRFVPDSGETERVEQSELPLLTAKLNNGVIEYECADEQLSDTLDPDHVEVRVTAIGLSAPDAADSSEFLSHELVGTVAKVGDNVRSVQPGTLVSALKLGSLSTLQRVPSDLVRPVPSCCSAYDAATIPSAYVTAMYSLVELSKVQAGENVVIVDGMGSVGQAAATLCRVFGANPIVITSSTLPASLLGSSGKSAPSIILQEPGSSITCQLGSLTNGRNIDVLFCSISTDRSIVTECGMLMAPLGRIVTLGYSPGSRSLLADLPPSSQNLSFFQLDMPSILKFRPKTVGLILEECWRLYSEGQIGPLGPVIFKKPTEIDQALHSIPEYMGSGKYVLAYDQQAVFNVVPRPNPLTFRDDASYLLVGCLGGLGRQVALWMADKGARHLIFVSRSGVGSRSATETVDTLRSLGTNVSVVKADITKRDELARLLGAVDPKYPIRGVLNAANVLDDGIFNKANISSWRRVTKTKVVGSLNLHELLKDHPLDFFVMTSSIAATLGSNGQANYSAANSMLDSLARHRRSRGLPAVSLILPAIFGIGMISENSKLEKAILMKGMYGIFEKEMLQAFEIAMRPQLSLPIDTDHIIVGMQPRRLGASVQSAAANLLSKEKLYLNWVAAQVGSEAGDGNNVTRNSGAERAKDVMAMIKDGGDQEEILQALVLQLSKRLSRLLMVEMDLISPTNKSVAGHGLDSMIGTEYRNWIFREFKFNIPFQQLLAGSLTISELARIILVQVSAVHANEVRQ